MLRYQGLIHTGESHLPTPLFDSGEAYPLHTPVGAARPLHGPGRPELPASPA